MCGGQLCREFIRARFIKNTSYASKIPVFKKLQILCNMFFKYSLLSTLLTSAAHFSHASHLPHWVTSLPSIKKPLLDDKNEI